MATALMATAKAIDVESAATAAQDKKEIELPANGMSLDLLRAVYRSSAIPLSVRMRAAMACLPFETPKLMAVAQLTENSFAELLDRRIENRPAQ